MSETPRDDQPEVGPGDVAEDPAEPDEDGKSSAEASSYGDPAGIPDAHPSNSPEED
jgi:hypothetical protein